MKDSTEMCFSFLPLLGVMIATVVDEYLMIYPLVPPEAKQGWKLELFECDRPILPHYHKLQRQFILVIDGGLKAFTGKDEVILRKGELIQIDPGVEHSLMPEKKCRFFAIDLPGFSYPEDVFEDHSNQSFQWMTPDSSVPPIDERYFREKIAQQGYAVYGLVAGDATENQWSVALLEIYDSPKHFHRIETEHFIVVNGILDLEVDGIRKEIPVGEAIAIYPGKVHKLKSATPEPVRVLCFNFPAFNPEDFYPVKED